MAVTAVPMSWLLLILMIILLLVLIVILIETPGSCDLVTLDFVSEGAAASVIFVISEPRIAMMVTYFLGRQSLKGAVCSCLVAFLATRTGLTREKALN